MQWYRLVEEWLKSCLVENGPGIDGQQPDEDEPAVFPGGQEGQ